MKVVRTVACDAKDSPIVATTVTPTVTHAADRATGFKTVDIAKLDEALANNDVKFEFYEDGRLKGLNATATGQGEAILKSALTVLQPILGIVKTNAFPTECQFIKDQAGGNKPLTLNYSGDVSLAAVARPAKIAAEDASIFYDANLASMIGTPCAEVVSIDQGMAPVTGGADTKGVLLQARQPAAAKVRVLLGRAAAGTKVGRAWFRSPRKGSTARSRSPRRPRSASASSPSPSPSPAR